MESACTIIGIAGASGSGKTMLAKLLARQLGDTSASLVSFDWYYHSKGHLSEEEKARCVFDHPDALDGELLAQQLFQLKKGEPIDAPGYDFTNHSRVAGSRIDPRPVIIVEGFLLLCFEAVRKQLDHSLFVVAPRDIRWERRCVRDMRERGRDAASIRRSWERDVVPAEDEFVLPSSKHADALLPNDAEPEQLLRRIFELPSLATISLLLQGQRWPAAG
jgi:uridine kinase